MPLKHLLVHLDGGDRSPVRLDLAVKLAQRFGAGLTGLFAEERAGRPRRGKGTPKGGRSAEEVAHLFAEQARCAPGGAEWWDIPNTEFDLAGVAARYARYADLTIVGQHDEEDPRVPADFAEQILLESGRPVLVIPSVGKFPDVGARVVIAWDGSRGAARAVNDALPLISSAKVAKVAVVRRARDRVVREDRTGPSILKHLARHGLNAQYEPMIVDGRSNAPDALGALLNLGADLDADLVVMGGRGNYGTPFPRAKRRTRASLAAMAAPLLLSM